MHFQAVIFDMDGIIFDSERAVLECWMEIAAEYGFTDFTEIYPRCIGANAASTKKVFMDFYGPDFPFETYKEERARRYHERYDNGRLPLKPGIKELLEYLKENNYLIGLASSTRSAVVIPQLRDAGLLSYFTDLTCGDMVARSKPEPDIFLKSCENLGVEPRQAIIIEDSYNGIRAAHRAGATPVMVPDMLEPDDEMRRLASHIFSSLLEVRDWLQSQTQQRKEMGV